MKKNKIGWCTHTVNPITGCVKISTGCENCYAHAQWKRFPITIHGATLNGDPYPFYIPRFHPERMKKFPDGALVFVGSMTDMFQNGINPEWLYKIFTWMYEQPKVNFLILTKRPENILLPLKFLYGPNVWIGVTIENNHNLGRLGMLKEKWNGHKFASFEPLLGGFNRDEDLSGLEWAIIGGENCRTGARPCEVDWVHTLVANCFNHHIPVYFKGPGTNNAKDFQYQAFFYSLKQFPIPLERKNNG